MTHPMTPERHSQLMRNDDLELTEEEIKAGWHFCWEEDGLLRTNDGDIGFCLIWSFDSRLAFGSLAIWVGRMLIVTR